MVVKILTTIVLSPSRKNIMKEDLLLKVTKNMYNSLFNIQTESKSEMEQLEDDWFVNSIFQKTGT